MFAQLGALTSTRVKSFKLLKSATYGENKISGTVTFTKVSGGIKILADINGLKPGEHGFHVHEHGDCSGADGMAAGGQFNPTAYETWRARQSRAPCRGFWKFRC